TGTSFFDGTLPNNTTYYYTVTAVNGNSAPLPSESAQSAEVSSQTLPVRLSITSRKTVLPGQPFPVTVSILDQNKSVVTNYFCTVHFTSNDPEKGVVLPPDYTFVASDQGVHTFMVTLITRGSRTVTVTDTADSTITASDTVMVKLGKGILIASAGSAKSSATPT